MKLIKHLKNKKGETLIEVITSTAILAVLVTAIVTIVMSCLQTNLAAKNLTEKDMLLTAGIDGEPSANYSRVDQSETLKITFPGGVEIEADGEKQISTDDSVGADERMIYFKTN